MRKKVYVTRNLPGKAIELLKKEFEVYVNEEDRNLTKEELIENIKEMDGVLCLLTDIIDEEVISNCKNVKVFANYAVGFNNIDISYANKRGIIVTNTPDVLTNTTAELAWSLLFAVARRIVESDKYTREGNFKEWKPDLLLGQDITGKTLGIIGAGSIGKAFAKRSLGYDMEILYYNRNRDYEFESNLKAKWVDKETLLKESDIVSIHVPLTEETRHMITSKEIALMKNTAIIINTSRGPVIKEEDLIEALKEKRIWGAGMDVFEREPYISKELMELNNVVLTPHIGSATIETREKMAMMAACNIIEVLNNRPPINLVVVK